MVGSIKKYDKDGWCERKGYRMLLVGWTRIWELFSGMEDDMGNGW